MRHPWSRAFEVVAVLAAGLVLSCGDDEPARDQAVLWMSLNTAPGQTCSSARSFNLPTEGARATITGTGQGERLVDGTDGSFVECAVTPAGGDGVLNVDFNMTSGEVTNFRVLGQVTMTSEDTGTGMVDVSFRTTSFALQQDNCTATAKAGLAGAVWLSNISCPGMVDLSSPGISCNGVGGLIAENCAR